MQPSRSARFPLRRAIPIRSGMLLAASIAGLHGCVTPPRTSVNHPIASSKCAVGATGTPAESIAVAATTPVNPGRAPFPTSSAERFVFAQIYETLIDVDCEGHAYPGLAKSWTTDETKTRVTLVLRDGAQFSNGEPLTARNVVAAWRTAGTASDSSLARRIADATTIVDDRTLLVSLPDTESLMFAEPALAVYRATATSRWPLGSGPYRALEPAADVTPGRLALV